MSIAGMNRELAKTCTEEEVMKLSMDCLVEHIKDVYTNLSCKIIFDKISAELGDLYFKDKGALVEFLDKQSENYVEVFCRLEDKITDIFHRLGWGRSAGNLSPFSVNFEYNSEKESFIFYGYYNYKVYEEINLKSLCDKLDSKKFLVF